METIKLLFRNNNEGISIQKVFDIIKPYLSLENKIECEYMPATGAKGMTILRNMFLTWRSRKKKYIYHITGAIHYLSYVLPKERTVTTVHDLLALKKAESYSWLKRKLIFLLWGKSLLRNNIIICISEKTKRELQYYFNVPEEKIKIIGDPIPETYTYSPKIFNKTKPIILHIGTKDNKNLDRTIFALKGLNVHLRIIGKLTPEIEMHLKESGILYSNDYNITEQQMYEEYLNCDIVSFPSTYEGFGMPIIEAQAIGRICITSNLLPMSDVAGNGALLVNPFDVRDMRKGYLRIITDDKLRQNLILSGLSNSSKYKASIIAAEYSNIYKTLKSDF